MRNARIILLGIALLIGLCFWSENAQAAVYHRPLCGARHYPRLISVIRDYAQVHNLSRACRRYPTRLRVLIADNNPNDPHYRGWLTRFTITHGGIPTLNLILGA